MPKNSKNKWSKSELKKLRLSLPSGWNNTLAAKHQLTPGAVENIIYGNAINDDVVISAIELANQYKELIASKKEAIASL